MQIVLFHFWNLDLHVILFNVNSTNKFLSVADANNNTIYYELFLILNTYFKRFYDIFQKFCLPLLSQVTDNLTTHMTSLVENVC